MKIFVIPSVYPNEININSGIFVHEQCKMLKKNGHEIIVLDASEYGWRSWNNITCYKKRAWTLEEIPIISYHYHGLAVSRLPKLSAWNYMRKLRKIYAYAINEYGKPDLFHAHFSFLAGYGTYLLSKESKIPYIVTEHYSLFLQEKINPKILEMLSLSLENAADFICVSSNLKNAITKRINTKKDITIIPNMIDDRFIYYPKPKSNIMRFFSAGNLIKSKGFEVLIEAFIITFDSNEKVELAIAGSGKDHTKLLAMINKHRRGHQIKLLGRLSREEMLEEYIKCDCFILPSKFETFGIVYREAMAVGRPVISTKNGGIEDGWKNEFGILIDSRNPNDIGKAMRYLYEHYDEYDGEKISQECINRYSANKVYNALNNTYSRFI